MRHPTLHLRLQFIMIVEPRFELRSNRVPVAIDAAAVHILTGIPETISRRERWFIDCHRVVPRGLHEIRLPPARILQELLQLVSTKEILNGVPVTSENGTVIVIRSGKEKSA